MLTHYRYVVYERRNGETVCRKKTDDRMEAEVYTAYGRACFRDMWMIDTEADKEDLT